MIGAWISIIVFLTCLGFLGFFFISRTNQDVKSKEITRIEQKQERTQKKEQEQEQEQEPVLWLDSRKGIADNGTNEVLEWRDARGDAYESVSAAKERPPMPIVKSTGVGLTSSMLVSRRSFPKSANCTLLLVCELPAPGAWGTIFGHFNSGADYDGVPWHSKDVQLRVTNDRRVSWHTSGDNTRATVPFDEIWPVGPTTAPVVFACTMNSDATTSTMRIAFATAKTRGSRATTVPRTIKDGSAPIVIGSSYANEFSHAVLYECVYFTETLAQADLERMTAELILKWT